MYNPFEQVRIQQLTSSYAPDRAPGALLDIGDYLSLVWRLDQNAASPGRVRYYRRCLAALGRALHISDRPLGRLIEQTAPGDLYAQLPNLPYRGPDKLLDAPDRQAALAELLHLRAELLRLGSRQENWDRSYPGSGILDEELRERVYAVLFTAFQGQYSNFGRLLLVIDIVLANLLVGFESTGEIALADLVADYDYPDPADAQVQADYAAG